MTLTVEVLVALAELALVVEAVAGVVGTTDDAVGPPSRKMEY